jgi:hypothetical protein
VAYFEPLSCGFLVRLRKPMKVLRVSGNLAEMRTRCLVNTGLKFYCYSIIFCIKNIVLYLVILSDPFLPSMTAVSAVGLTVICIASSQGKPRTTEELDFVPDHFV